MKHHYTRRLGQGAAALGLAVLCLAGAGSVRADQAPVTPSRVRFLLRADCTCASCGFAMQDQLHKLRGVSRVDLSVRDRLVTVTFDESQAPLSRVAAVLAGTDIGKRSALIADLAPTQPAPEPAALTRLAGIRQADVDRKKDRLLLELSNDAPLTTAELSATLTKAGITARLEPASQAAALHR